MWLGLRSGSSPRPPSPRLRARSRRSSLEILRAEAEKNGSSAPPPEDPIFYAVEPRGRPRPRGLTFCMNMVTNITMLTSTPQSGSRPAGSHLVLFDGTCGLCASLVSFVLPRDRAGVFHFASLDSATGRSVVAQLGGDPDDSATMHVVADHVTPHARHLTRAPAALFVVGAIGWPW